MGAGVGAGLYGIASAQGIVGKEESRTTTQAVINDGAASSTRKIFAEMERNMIPA